MINVLYFVCFDKVEVKLSLLLEMMRNALYVQIFLQILRVVLGDREHADIINTQQQQVRDDVIINDVTKHPDSMCL